MYKFLRRQKFINKLRIAVLELTIVLILLTSTIANGTHLNFGKRYKDNFRVIFDHWPKLHLGLDAINNQKILKGI